ncbi:hypothetical protein NDU88_000963 [Pleurodeles waltl]|uniref:Uncharacterized protein n=1 Tax=Pleurodeles waltl TaxID=8319 RepID=A0AAV7RB92_PLEWA|nr:hypothetical protein NDU88_000963 [Pleurodeles waltl]
MGPISSAEIFRQMAIWVPRDHEYGPGVSLDSENFSGTSKPSTEADQSSVSQPSGSDQALDEPKQLVNRKGKSSHTRAETVVQNNLFFDPENIFHPRSTEWVLSVEVAHYVQERLRKSFSKDVRNTLRLESPLPSLLSKVDGTRELDPSMAMFLKKFAKDLKKGLDRAWRGCQDKLLDISGPLTKVLELAVQVKDSSIVLYCIVL